MIERKYMDNTVKPNFSSNVTNNNDQVNLAKLIERRKNRKEIGAGWTAFSKTSGKNYLNLNFKKAELQELLSNSSEETVKFVAFMNPNKDEGSKRPDYVIFKAEN